jgi:hypothetical protein
MALTTGEDSHLYNQLRVLTNMLGAQSEVCLSSIDHWLITMYSTLKIEAVCLSRTSLNLYQATRHQIPEDSTLLISKLLPRLRTNGKHGGLSFSFVLPSGGVYRD